MMMTSKMMVVLAALCSGGTLFAQSSTSTLSLSSFLQERDLDPTKVKFVGSVLSVDATSSWKKGIQGPIYMERIGLRGLTSAAEEGVPYGLRVSYNGLSSQVTACYGSDCSNPEEQKQEGARLNVKEQGFAWEVQFTGNPCKTGLGCTFYVPSWALTQLNRTQGISHFPKRLVAVQYETGLTLWDAETKRTWLGVDELGSLFEDLGSILSMRLRPNGELLLRSKAGAVVLNFGDDTVLRISDDGLYRLGAGPGHLAESTLISLVSLNSEEVKKSRVVDLTDQGIFLEDSVILPPAKDSTADEYRRIDWPGQILSVSESSGQSVVLSRVGDEIQRWTLAAGEDRPKRLGEAIHADDSTDSEFLLIGAEAYHQHPDNGLFWVNEQGSYPTNLKSLNGEYLVRAEGFATAVTHSDAGCRWQLFRHDAAQPTAFKSTGIEDLCDTWQTISASSDSATITMFNGAHISIRDFKLSP